MRAIQKLFGRAIVIHTATLELCLTSKSPYETAAFLERLVYFQTLKEERGEDPWVYDTREQLMAQLYFSERQLKNAIAFLKEDIQILQTDRRLITYQNKPSTVTHYLVDTERLELLLVQQKINPNPRSDESADAKNVDFKPSDAMSDAERYAASDADACKTSDAYKGTKSQAQSQAQSLVSPLRDEHAAGEEPAASSAATAPQEAQRAAESVVPDIRIQSREQAPKSLRDLAADLRRRKPGGNPPPSALQAMAEQEVPAGTGGESQMVVPAAPQQEQQASIPPLRPAPLSPKKPAKAPKEKAPRKRDGFADSIAVACYGTVEGHTKSVWSSINKAKAELVEAGVSVDDAAEIVEWMKRDPYWQKRGVEPASIPYQVSKWRASRAKPEGTSKVADFLRGKYGEEDLF